jgi:hypothetical protein
MVDVGMINEVVWVFCENSKMTSEMVSLFVTGNTSFISSIVLLIVRLV